MIGLFLIYFLIDPRDGSIRYVGQTRRGQIEKRAAKRRKPFICIETNETFDSISDFVSKGKGSSAVKRVLNGKQETVNGLHYRRI